MDSRTPLQWCDPIRWLLLASGVWSVTGRCLPHARETWRDEVPAREADLFAAAVDHQMDPLVAAFARATGLGHSEDWHALSRVHRLSNAERYRGLTPVVRRMAADGVRVMLIKGGDLALHSYAESIPRPMTDLDLLVRPEDIPDVAAAFEREGYLQGELDPERAALRPLSPQERLPRERGHYELWPFSAVVRTPSLDPFAAVIRAHLGDEYIVGAGSAVSLHVAYDVHFNVSRTLDVEDLWRDTRSIELPDGGTVLAQSFADLLWLIASRMYHEIMAADSVRMLSFVDLLAIVARHGGEIAWDRVVQMADRYRLHPSLFYALYHANEFLEPGIPDDMLTWLRPSSHDRPRGHDWGDFMPKLMGYSAVTSVLGGHTEMLPSRANADVMPAGRRDP